MPEAAVNEYREFRGREDDVDATESLLRAQCDVLAKAQAASVEL